MTHGLSPHETSTCDVSLKSYWHKSGFDTRDCDVLPVQELRPLIHRERDEFGEDRLLQKPKEIVGGPRPIPVIRHHRPQTDRDHPPTATAIPASQRPAFASMDPNILTSYDPPEVASDGGPDPE